MVDERLSAISRAFFQLRFRRRGRKGIGVVNEEVAEIKCVRDGFGNGYRALRCLGVKGGESGG